MGDSVSRETIQNTGGAAVIFFLFMGRCLIKQSGIHLASAMILCSISAAIASAAEYPTKTIQIINPFPPGAVTDIVARIAAPKLSTPVSYTHLRAHETPEHLVCRLLLEKKKN